MMRLRAAGPPPEVLEGDSRLLSPFPVAGEVADRCQESEFGKVTEGIP